MNVLNIKEFEKWTEGFKDMDPDYVHFDGRTPYYSHPEAACIEVMFPEIGPDRMERLAFFARCLATMDYDVRHFAGATIWITDCVGSELEQHIGYQIVESMIHATGQSMAFEAVGSFNFRGDELVRVTGLLMQPMLFAWDAYYLPHWTWGGSSEFFLQVSHDSYVLIFTKTKAYHDKAFKELQDLGFSPKPRP